MLIFFFAGIVHLNGFGASFPYDVYQEWIDRYRVYREPHVALDMNYISTGSGTGIALITGQLYKIDYKNTRTLLTPWAHPG